MSIDPRMGGWDTFKPVRRKTEPLFKPLNGGASQPDKDTGILKFVQHVYDILSVPYHPKSVEPVDPLNPQGIKEGDVVLCLHHENRSICDLYYDKQVGQYCTVSSIDGKFAIMRLGHEWPLSALKKVEVK